MERPKAIIRWSVLLRLLAMVLVQIFLVRCLLLDNVLTRYWVLGDKWFSTSHSGTVILAAIVANVSLCGIIMLMQWDNAILVAIVTCCAFVGTVIGLCFTPVVSGYGLTNLTWVFLGAFSGWFFGCLLMGRLRARVKPLAMPRLQFTLGEIFLATIVAAIGAWLLSWTF